MERSSYSFTYKGSIPDAINESRNQKKLFMVYISGADENSVKMDQTWLDERVAESISKCCIFLHLTAGSLDASQFSAIYPQKSTPSICTIGLNGVMLWHYEGYITTENLIENIDKAWAALHMQEAALTLLTVALASKEPEPLNSTPNAVSAEQVVSSDLNIPSTSADKSSQDSEPRPLTDSQQLEDERLSESNSQKDNLLGEETCSQMDTPNDVKIRSIDGSSSSRNIAEEALSILSDVNSETYSYAANSNVPVESSTMDKTQAATKSEPDTRSAICGPVPSEITTEAEEETPPAKKVDGSSGFSDAVKSKDVHLNIRIPNGTSLQTKLTLADTLRSVKIFVDENLDTMVGSYDLAVPYPRKLFNHEDMTRTLSELGFASREALIVVPHRQATRAPRGQSSSNDSQNGVTRTVSSENTGGYFDYAKRILSYVNPLSYLGGNSSSANSETAESDGLWQYRPNPAIQNHLSGAPRRLSSSSDQSNQNTDSHNTSGGVRPSPSRQFGSNIHTLRHDDDPSGDKNMFWNGNSTQFGGDDKK
ncbi:unnamed protein product [Musa acuminata subsp. burmannicoides]